MIWKEWRLWLLVIALVVAVIGIGPNPWASGVTVKHVDDDSPFKGKIKPGDTISRINDNIINSKEDLLQFKDFEGVMRVNSGGDVILVDKKPGGLGISVGSKSPYNIHLGMDLKGGTKVILKPKFNESDRNITEKTKTNLVKQAISTLKTRMNIYGLKEIKFRSLKDVGGRHFIQIQTSGMSKKKIEDLLARQGKFEAYITRTVDMKNGTGKLRLGDNIYNIEKLHKKVKINGRVLEKNDSTKLGNLTFEFWNSTNTSAVLAGKTFSSEDIQFVYSTGRKSYVTCAGGSCQFRFHVLVSDAGAERFAEITQNISSVMDFKSNETYLKESIYLFLDEKLVDSLRISSGLKGKPYTTHVITGGAETKEEARKEMNKLQAILRSGSLPVELEMVSSETISPSLGSGFLRSLSIAGAAALLAVGSIIYFRYRNLKITFLVLLTSISEILIIFGVAGWAGGAWTIDLAALAGVIAAIGSGVDDQIVITDETIRGENKRSFSVKRRVKKAFFIIFMAAATTIAAMLPLAFIGIGIMRGFAISTIIGVLGGISITRPAYGKFVEYVLK